MWLILSPWRLETWEMLTLGVRMAYILWSVIDWRTDIYRACAVFKADVASDGDLLFGEMAASPLESQLLSDYWGGRSTKFFSAGKSWIGSLVPQSLKAALQDLNAASAGLNTGKLYRCFLGLCFSKVGFCRFSTLYATNLQQVQVDQLCCRQDVSRPFRWRWWR